ncbi:Isochorismatase hydrolase [Aureobasidium subglaciale]|nr:Isochorismatase hydrolase [Aureobasidium subglaciale]KAI5220838.1 Isochorismatase hydrolase [Aureobasidium subglaciale]KAI5224741.1 Isochorismatase hydrolase [Aureobasidium subglaciale]KAI5260877.1 Isochorismatase hydrolase [Aureobasidium subglaciale]
MNHELSNAGGKMELPSARPYAFRFRPESTAVVIIDMQRDFLDRGGFGELQCGNAEIFENVRQIVPQTKEVLKAARKLGLHVIHTREGHTPNLSDLPASKRLRQKAAPSGHHHIGIGDEGPMGRLLVQGEYGHDIIDDLKPVPGETVIDKPGKGSFWNTTLHRSLLARGITHLLIAGVTTECCVNTTFREASDRGFECCVLTDCTSGFEGSFVDSTLNMLCSYDGLFGYVCASNELLNYAHDSHPTPPRTPPGFQGDLSLASLQRQFKNREITVVEVAKDVSRRVSEYQKKDPAVWTYLQSGEKLLKAAQALEERYMHQPLPPLYGIPFAVKDNIDVEGIFTTGACQQASYMPKKSAKVVTALIRAGALFIGKTNLDQLAAGLSGCRSPFGYPRSVFDHERVSGGSSSGSAVAVAAGLVTFALGTDTAGSGRVPAAFNGITGFKPTRSTLSAEGLVPACRSLDTISILALTVIEARVVWLVADEGPDMSDPFAKTQQSLPLWHVDFRGVREGGFVFGVPPASALAICTPTYRKHFDIAVERLERSGGVRKEVEWTPFEGGSQLLYNGALMNERVQCADPEFLLNNQQHLHPTTRKLFEAAMGRDLKPWDVYRDQHLQATYTRQAALIFEEIDVLLVPTTTCHPTVAEMESDPITLNAKLGEFTHFANVLDLCGIAVPASCYEENAAEPLPFGVTLIGASGTDGKVFDIAKVFEETA